jgi:hypothetical protein
MNCAAAKNMGWFCLLNNEAEGQPIELRYNLLAVRVRKFFLKKIVTFGHVVAEIWLCEDSHLLF